MAAKAKSPDLRDEHLLKRLVDEVKRVNEKLDSLMGRSAKGLGMLEEFLKNVNIGGLRGLDLKLEPDALSLLSLPMSLRKTVMVLYKLERATAEELAKETKRLRAVESAAANQLVRMGYLKKAREGRDVYFYIDSPVEIKR
jgi:hypothetical protein